MARRLALAAVAAALLGSGRAEAYCRSAVCPGEGAGMSTKGQVCVPAQDSDCGLVLGWRQGCVGFNIQRDASKQIDYATAESTLRQALEAWTQVDCGNGKPSIEVTDLGSASCDKIEYNQHDGNANILLFRDAFWPHPESALGGTADTIALTTVTYDVDKGDIYDADIEVNTSQNHFTLGDSSADVDVDFLSVLTHEAGHFLGMAHSPEAEATMYPDYINGSLNLRSLSPDDVTGICAAYPPGRATMGDCTSLPRHGFSPSCVGEQTEGKCSLTAGPSGDAPGWAIVALSLAAAAQTTRARARKKIS